MKANDRSTKSEQTDAIDKVILKKNKQLFSFFSWSWDVLYLYNTLMNQAPTENILWMLQCYLPGQSDHNMTVTVVIGY